MASSYYEGIKRKVFGSTPLLTIFSMQSPEGPEVKVYHPKNHFPLVLSHSCLIKLDK